MDELGFDWDPVNSLFEKGVDALRQYKETYGDCLVPSSYTINGFKLGSWVWTKRGSKKRGALSAEVVDRLNAIGFVWDPNTSQWDRDFQAIKKYQAHHGDCLVPRGLVVDGLNLGNVVRNLRSQYARKKLSSQQVADLNSIGFVWLVEPYVWDRFFEALKQYKAEKGDCLVPQGFVFKNLKLGGWIQTQRQSRVQGKLSQEKIHRLEAIGFVWEPYEFAWNQKFQALQRFQNEYGHLDVPPGLSYHGIELGYWVRRQRTFRRQGRLTDEKVARLDAIDFIWESRSS